MLSGKCSAPVNRGFTLIELMVVVVIVAVLMTVALPAYKQQVARGHRAAAQAEMLEVAGLQQQYLLSNRSYMDGPALTAAGYTPDPVVSRHYVSSLVLGTGPVPTYQLRLTPVGAQQDDGWLALDSEGNHSSQFSNKWWR